MKYKSAIMIMKETEALEKIVIFFSLELYIINL
jgi:hypothetical protein